MESSLREIEQREKMKKEKRHIETMIKYERAKICPKCGELMRYAFGEVFKCDHCGQEELTSFGKVESTLKKMDLQMHLIFHEEPESLYQLSISI